MDLSLPINWNEDEVPLDEKDVERIWLDWGKRSGFYATHIENIGSSMPDSLMIWKGITFFHEVKIRRGNLIYLQQYQWANFTVMRHHCHQWQLNIVVWNNGQFDLYSMDQLKSVNAEPAGKGKVKVKIGLLQPLISVATFEDFNVSYTEWLRSKIWKKKT